MSLRDKATTAKKGCPDYSAREGSKACMHYRDKGCSLSDHPLCELWLAANPSVTLPRSEGVTEERRTTLAEFPGYRLAVTAGTWFKGNWRTKAFEIFQAEHERLNAGGVKAPAQRDASSKPSVLGLDDPDLVEARLGRVRSGHERIPTDDEIESWKALGSEVCVTSETLGELWLVPAYTDADRQEMTPEDLATLTRLLVAFPGSSVEEIRNTRKNKDGGDSK